MTALSAHECRSIEQLVGVLDAVGSAEFVFFWRHTPTSAHATGPWVLSQWYPSPFTVDGVAYRTAEHWMMAEKARLFGDRETLAAILASEHPRETQQLGRRVRGFEGPVWDEHRYDIVMRGSVHKFASTPELRAYLLGTGERVLVEASPVDRIWGVGLDAAAAAAAAPGDWRGLNLLGFALMEARSRLAA